MSAGPLRTPDGRYIVVRGRLWRATDPRLPEAERARLVAELGAARRAVAAARRSGGDVAAARARVDAAKRGLGERGPAWWADGAPDLTRRLARTTGYAAWFAGTGSGVGDAKETAMTQREKPAEPGADILPDTPVPGETPAKESESIEEEGDPIGDNFA